MNVTDFFAWLAAGHAGLLPSDYAWNAVFGAVGAATAYLADTEGHVLMPRYNATTRELELGALGRVLVGAGAGIAVGYDTFVPFAAGVVAPTVLPILVDKVQAWLGNGAGK